MSTQEIVHKSNLGLEFDLGNIEANKIRLKVGGTLTVAADGTVDVNQSALTLVSADTGNVLVAGGDNGVFFDQAALQAIETNFAAVNGSPSLLTITAGGTNGHAPTIAIDPTSAAWVEAIQDAIGQAAITGSGITYDDVNNALNVALQNLSAGNGIDISASQVSVVADPTSPSPVTVTAAGVSVTPGISTATGNLSKLGPDNRVLVDPADIAALATEEICDAFGTPLFKAFPL